MHGMSYLGTEVSRYIGNSDLESGDIMIVTY